MAAIKKKKSKEKSKDYAENLISITWDWRDSTLISASILILSSGLLYGGDSVWWWIALEYVEGDDLFDRIEADVGAREDIGQIYFLQLVGGVNFL